jgi:uncharacterized protein Veg
MKSTPGIDYTNIFFGYKDFKICILIYAYSTCFLVRMKYMEKQPLSTFCFVYRNYSYSFAGILQLTSLFFYPYISFLNAPPPLPQTQKNPPLSQFLNM